MNAAPEAVLITMPGFSDSRNSLTASSVGIESNQTARLFSSELSKL